MKMDNIKNNFNAVFHGYPSQSSANNKTLNKNVCQAAIEFLVKLIMWFVIYVEPNIEAFTEEMAIQIVASKLLSNAQNHFRMHESASTVKTKTLQQFVLYMLKNYIRVENMHELKKAILSEMPSDYELHQSLTESFASHKMASGIFLEIIKFAKLEKMLDDTQFNDLVISDRDIFWYRYKFASEKGILDTLNIELSDHPSDIRHPQTLDKLMEALLLLETKQNERAQAEAVLKAKDIKVRQRSGYTDPTSTMAGKNTANINYGRQNNPRSNFNQNNRGGRRTHTWKECNNKAHCRIHSKRGRKQQPNNSKYNNSNSQSNNYNKNQNRSNRNNYNNRNQNHNQNRQHRSNYNQNHQNQQKQWNGDSTRNRYNQHKQRGGRGRGKNGRRGRRFQNQKNQNVQQQRSHQRYNTNGDQNGNQQGNQHQNQNSNQQSYNNNNNNNKSTNNINQTKKQNKYQNKKKSHYQKRNNNGKNQNRNNNNNNNNNQNHQNYTHFAYAKPYVNLAVANVCNSDLESNSTNPESLHFAAPVTVAAANASATTN